MPILNFNSTSDINTNDFCAHFGGICCSVKLYSTAAKHAVELECPHPNRINEQG